jgi:hypothetical protein
VTPRRLHEPHEQTPRVLDGESLGMPLDAEPERMLGILDRLDDPVGGQADDADTAPGLIDTLVMRTVDLEPGLAEKSGEARVHGELDAMNRAVSRVALFVVEGAGTQGRKILDERSAANDRHELCPAADSEYRTAIGLRLLEKGPFQAASVLSRRIDAGTRGLPVPLRWDVEGAATEQKPGETFVPALLGSRDGAWLRTRAGQSLYVAGLDRALTRAIEIRRDTDDGTHAL